MSRSAPEEKAAIEMAQALLGSMAQQPPDLPPPVQATPPLLRRPNKPSPPPKFLETTLMKSKTTPLLPLHPNKKPNLLTLPPLVTDYCNVCCARYQSHLRHSSLR